MRRALLIVALLLCGGCETSDVGSACPEMEIPTDSGATTEGDVLRAQGSNSIEYNAEFTCQSTVCVATLGNQPYCSQECGKNAQCPDGFACKQVMTLGSFSDYKYCTWSECSSATDCGDEEDFACRKVPELSLDFEVRLCDFRQRQ